MGRSREQRHVGDHGVCGDALRGNCRQDCAYVPCHRDVGSDDRTRHRDHLHVQGADQERDRDWFPVGRVQCGETDLTRSGRRYGDRAISHSSRSGVALGRRGLDEPVGAVHRPAVGRRSSSRPDRATKNRAKKFATSWSFIRFHLDHLDACDRRRRVGAELHASTR